MRSLILIAVALWVVDATCPDHAFLGCVLRLKAQRVPFERNILNVVFHIGTEAKLLHTCKVYSATLPCFREKVVDCGDERQKRLLNEVSKMIMFLCSPFSLQRQRLVLENQKCISSVLSLPATTGCNVDNFKYGDHLHGCREYCKSRTSDFLCMMRTWVSEQNVCTLKDIQDKCGPEASELYRDLQSSVYDPDFPLVCSVHENSTTTTTTTTSSTTTTTTTTPQPIVKKPATAEGKVWTRKPSSAYKSLWSKAEKQRMLVQAGSKQGLAALYQQPLPTTTSKPIQVYDILRKLLPQQLQHFSLEMENGSLPLPVYQYYQQNRAMIPIETTTLPQPPTLPPLTPPLPAMETLPPPNIANIGFLPSNFKTPISQELIDRLNRELMINSHLQQRHHRPMKKERTTTEQPETFTMSAKIRASSAEITSYPLQNEVVTAAVPPRRVIKWKPWYMGGAGDQFTL